MLTGPDVDRATVAPLVALRERLDPFALADTIERQLEVIYALANHRQSPAGAATGAPDRAAAPPSPPARRRGALPPMQFGKAATNYDRRRLVTS